MKLQTVKWMIPLCFVSLISLSLSACSNKSGTTASTSSNSAVATTTTKPAMILTSSAFENNGKIPDKYTAAGENISPPLTWKNLPEGAKSLVIMVDDTDARLFTHWVIYNIPPGTKSLAAGIPANDTLADGSLQGYNGTNKIGYTGPNPPFGTTHHYRFRLYALNVMLNLQPGATKAQVLEKMTGHIIDDETAELIGIYGR
ncbi:MAG: YbhB/YbcL family Raf kinase inhibitor-like protein [Dehalococcoidales bacterium]|nr:YbhB/YbcL family Raf kinase inhibitor-like protein [Dehalococcoidales bacterium]